MSTIYWTLDNTLKRWILFFRYLHSAVVSSGMMLIFGGNTHNDTAWSYGAKCFSADVIAYDILCDRWDSKLSKIFLFACQAKATTCCCIFKTTHSCRYLGGTTCKELCLMWRIWAQIWPDLATQPCSFLCPRPIETQQVWPVVIYFWRGVSWESSREMSEKCLEDVDFRS